MDSLALLQFATACGQVNVKTVPGWRWPRKGKCVCLSDLSLSDLELSHIQHLCFLSPLGWKSAFELGKFIFEEELFTHESLFPSWHRIKALITTHGHAKLPCCEIRLKSIISRTKLRIQSNCCQIFSTFAQSPCSIPTISVWRPQRQKNSFPLSNLAAGLAIRGK